MSFDDILLETEEHFEKSVSVLEDEFRRIRTGRASPNMLDYIQVEAYGTTCPITQLAGVSVPEPQQLLIKAYDQNMLTPIERAISASDLGLTPQNDGKVIRLNLPTLTSERRDQLAVQAKEVAEKAKVAMRNARRDGIKQIEAEGKEQNVGEDLVKQTTEEVTELLKKYEAQVDKKLEAKVADITTI